MNSPFHRSQKTIVPSFCHNLKDPKEHEWHCLDVRRALSVYRDCTRSFRKTDSFFVSFSKASLGKGVSHLPLVGGSGVIIIAYQSSGIDIPMGIIAHSLRGASATAAYRSFPSLEVACKVAKWSSVHTFTKHYKVDKLASIEAAFGHSVLQRALHP